MYNFSNLTPPKKVAAVHDVSCFGRCAQTVIIPVMSALGMQVIPLPTALLSSHTGGFDGFTFLDLTEEMTKIQGHWKDLDLCFDSVYTGFLGSKEQIDGVFHFARECKKNNPSCLFLADPVMGDDGEKYKTYTQEMCLLTRRLIADADVITPNVTEACILTDTPYRTHFDDGEMKILFDKLSSLTKADIVITGFREGDKICSAYRHFGSDYFGKVYSHYIDKNYPGTGDIFSSVLLSLLLKGKKLQDAVSTAGSFVSAASDFTSRFPTPVREGLSFEPLLGALCRECE